jgi:hypothetical protein
MKGKRRVTQSSRRGKRKKVITGNNNGVKEHISGE